MRILVISDSFYPDISGGAGLIAYYQARGLKDHGDEVHVLTMNQPQAHYFLDGIQVTSFYFDYSLRLRRWVSLFNPWLAWKVKKYIQFFKPDIIHFHNIHIYFSYLSIQMASRFNIPIFVTFHDLMSVAPGKVKVDQIKQKEDWIYRRIKSVLSRTQNLAVSLSLKTALQHNGVKVDDVLRNYLPQKEFPNLFPEQADQIRKQYGIPKQKSLLLFSGRINRLKGSQLLLEIMPRISSRAHLVIVGGVGQSTDLVTYIPWVSHTEMFKFYQLVDIVLVPSLYLDPFPTVALEAFQQGKPVIGTIFGGLPELVDDGVNGFLLDPRDQTLLVEKINQLIENSSLRLKFGMAGYKKYTQEFTLKSGTDKLIGIYEKNLNNRD